MVAFSPPQQAYEQAQRAADEIRRCREAGKHIHVITVVREYIKPSLLTIKGHRRSCKLVNYKLSAIISHYLLHNSSVVVAKQNYN